MSSYILIELQSPSHIIKFFFALMYSSEEALGRDMSMTPIWNGDVSVTPQYDIVVVQTRQDPLAPIVSKTYRTLRLISGIGAETIRGRGTRVWEVQEVKCGKVDRSKNYVLKDVWVDTDRMREGNVVTEIRKDAAQLMDANEKQALLDCLLKTSFDGDVLLSDGAVDCTISGRKRGRHISKNDERFNLTPYSAPPELKPTSPPPGPSQNRKGKRGGARRTPGDHHDAADDTKGAQKAIVYDAKTHYRIVFEEVCDVLHEIKSIRKIMYTLWKACGGEKFAPAFCPLTNGCIALEVLHKLGWVHRDISSGNIMLYGSYVKITDFEYAKKMTLPGKVHEIRTVNTIEITSMACFNEYLQGTEDFMAIEVRSQYFRFLPSNKYKPLFSKPMDQWSVDIDATLPDSYGEPELATSPPTKYTWFYNPLHDLESIFWLMLYFTGNKDITLGPPIEREKPYVFVQETIDEYRDRILAYWNFGLTLFSSRNGRADVMKEDVLDRHLHLHPLHPAIAPLGNILCQLRAALATRFEEIECNPPAIHHNSGGGLYDIFQTLLRRAVVHLQTVPFDVEVRSLRGAVEALPRSYRADRVNNSVNSTRTDVPTGSKRVRDAGGDDGRQPKSPRISLDQKSPSPAISSCLPEKGRSGAGETTRQTKTAVPLPTRVLRSQSRKAVDAKTSPPSPRPATRTRHAAVPKSRKGKATKNHEAAKAAAKVAATKVKSKTRKGR